MAKGDTKVQVKNNRSDGNPVARGGYIFPADGDWYTVNVPKRKLVEVRACRHLDTRFGDDINPDDDHVDPDSTSGNPEAGTRVDPQPTVEAEPENLDPDSDDPETADVAEPDGDDEEFEGYDAWGVNELREECRNRELPVSGSKADLVARLDENDLEDDDE